MKLSELKFGQQAIIEKVGGGDLALKLFEMGILPGEEVALENIAPFGDPIALRVGESKVCIRTGDAAQIEVRLR